MGSCTAQGFGGATSRALRFLLTQRCRCLLPNPALAHLENRAQAICGARRSADEENEEEEICGRWELGRKIWKPEGVVCSSIGTVLQESFENKKRGELSREALWDRFASSIQVSARDVSSSSSSSVYLMNDPRLVEPLEVVVPRHYSRMPGGVSIAETGTTLVSKLAVHKWGNMLFPGLGACKPPLEASSVKRKRKKKMNKHKQRKLRRRDRHRK